MIFNPVLGRPRITQWFGERPEYYKKYGTNGHAGIDFGMSVGTPIYAPHEGYVQTQDNGKLGYGKHIIITSKPYNNDKVCRRSTLAHLSKFAVQPGSFVAAGDLIGYSGNTGDSTGPHLHWTYCQTDEFGTILNYNNGFHGAIDLAPLVNGKRKSYIILWTGATIS